MNQTSQRSKRASAAQWAVNDDSVRIELTVDSFRIPGDWSHCTSNKLKSFPLSAFLLQRYTLGYCQICRHLRPTKYNIMKINFSRVRKILTNNKLSTWSMINCHHRVVLFIIKILIYEIFYYTIKTCKYEKYKFYLKSLNHGAFFSG